MCPDPKKAPPKPTTEASTTGGTSLSSSIPTTTATTTTQKKVEYTTIPSSTTKQYIPDGVVLTAIAGKFPERPSTYIPNLRENRMAQIKKMTVLMIY